MQLEYYVSSSQPDYIGWLKRTLKQTETTTKLQVLTRITNRNEYRCSWNIKTRQIAWNWSNTFALAAPVWCVSFFRLNSINIYADILLLLMINSNDEVIKIPYLLQYWMENRAFVSLHSKFGLMRHFFHVIALLNSSCCLWFIVSKVISLSSPDCCCCCLSVLYLKWTKKSLCYSSSPHGPHKHSIRCRECILATTEGNNWGNHPLQKTSKHSVGWLFSVHAYTIAHFWKHLCCCGMPWTQFVFIQQIRRFWFTLGVLICV